jgi:hypothetical protein
MSQQFLKKEPMTGRSFLLRHVHNGLMILKTLESSSLNGIDDKCKGCERVPNR